MELVFVADMHAITTLRKKKSCENMKDIVAVYLACGLDPEKATLIFNQKIHITLNCLDFECHIFR